MLKAKLTIYATIASTALTALHYEAKYFTLAEDYLSKTFHTKLERSLESVIAPLGYSKQLTGQTLTLSEEIEKTAQNERISPKLIEALIEVESGWKPNAIRYEPTLAKGTSDQDRMTASSHGLMQILPFWCSKCPEIKTWADLYAPEKNIRCGTHILSEALKESKSVYEALIIYNGGSKCSQFPNCKAQAELHANKVLRALAEKMV